MNECLCVDCQMTDAITVHTESCVKPTPFTRHTCHDLHMD